MNELEVTCEVEGQTARISLAGEFDLAGEPVFEQQLERVTPAPAQTVVLDLRGLTLIGSRGLAAILRADDRSRGEGCRLAGAGRRRVDAGVPELGRPLARRGARAQRRVGVDRDMETPARTRATASAHAAPARARLAAARPRPLRPQRQARRSLKHHGPRAADPDAARVWHARAPTVSVEASAVS